MINHFVLTNRELILFIKYSSNKSGNTYEVQRMVGRRCFLTYGTTIDLGGYNKNFKRLSSLGRIFLYNG